eukprot:TRINITY_DN6203_c0_g1_i2.p1 TRINITY_DN6203_c0_g1~~TRINITY_DN6203_c0_g1_i2.p1  ORF type:complete len:311 (-),score=56.16 TRINITY_DN6203_c0_g1_i2:49-981(-)
MHRTRPLTQQRMYGMGFIAIVLMIIFGIHLAFVLLVWGPKLGAPGAERAGAASVLFLYHLFFINLLASFYQCVMIDPGVVPPNWGFYMGDETKRRRYCKMCNVWKPDRTHHCSICNRCILNMDHHCPWINNCVGFYNRKFFMQLLTYVYLSLTVVVLFTIPEMYVRLVQMTESPSPYSDTGYLISSIILAMAFFMATLLICTLTNFIKFHMKLVLENYTTIENLEREEGAKSKFDIGRRRNWEQVFGASPWVWWLPLHTQASRPIGDGVRWRVHYTRVIDEDEELPADEEGTSQASRLLNQGNTARSGGR